MTDRPLTVDLVVDVVCPWCFIGEAKLRRALADRADVAFEVRVLPFLLDPSTPLEGRDLREWLARKYGTAPSAMFARVEQAAHAAGLPLDFAKITRIPNTLSAHVLIRAAAARGTQLELARAILDAYFLEGADVSEPNVLASVAARHGFERDETIAILRDEDARETIRAEAQALGRRGVSGVPFFVFGGTHAVSGAQPEELLLRAVDAALAAQ